MKRKLFMALMVSVLLFSCTHETSKNTHLENTESITVRNNQWKNAVFTSEIIENQKAISHYEFDIDQLQSLLDDEAVVYIWFDLELNNDNQITFAAAGVNNEGTVLGQVQSNIVSLTNYEEDFSIFDEVQDLPLNDEDPIVASHVLANGDAHQYIVSMRDGYENIEDALDYNGQRVERFGLEAVVVKRMLETYNIHSLALFLGKNNDLKMTTVFVGKDAYGSLIVDGNSQTSSNIGRVYDLTMPCPPFSCGDLE